MTNIEIKGKRSDVALALKKLKMLFKNHSIKEKIPEYFYRCSATSRISIGLDVDVKYISKESLDSLKLSGVTVEVINNNFESPISFRKTSKSLEFFVRKDNISKNAIVIKKPPIKTYYQVSTSFNNNYYEEFSDELLSEETLEQYEQRIYG